jgi:hypothetical protein
LFAKQSHVVYKKKYFIISILCLGIFQGSNAQKVAFWDGFEFDNNSIIVGFPSGSNSEQNHQFAFIIKTKKDFDQLKGDWVFEQKSFGKKPDNSIAIYRVKDKKGEWVGTIYPSINKLTNIRASFGFDTLKLVELAKKHPFHYLHKVETFKSREDYMAQYNKEILEKNYLFSFGPGKWDGSFKINIHSSDTVSTPVAAINVLSSKLSAFTSPDNYSLRYELSENNKDYKKSFKITVDCLKFVYDQYNDPVYIKSDGVSEQIFMTSFWEK